MFIAVGNCVGVVVLAAVGASVGARVKLLSSKVVGRAVLGWDVVGISVGASVAMGETVDGAILGALVSSKTFDGAGATTTAGGGEGGNGAVLGLLSPPETAITNTTIPPANKNKHRIVMETHRLLSPPVFFLVMAR